MYKLEKIQCTGRRSLGTLEYFDRRHFDMQDGFVNWNALPESARNDVIENVYDASDYLKREWNLLTFKECLEDSVNPPVLQIRRLELDNLGAGRLTGSDPTVDKYIKMISDGMDMDPIMVNNGKFYDGRHRMMAYKQSGRRTIPTIDIAPMLNTDWSEWLERNGKGAWED